jgi:hypothetical protein
MLIELAAAVSVAASNAANAAPGRPLREVVYRVSFSRRTNETHEFFHGDHPDQYKSSISLAADSGTITVDVMQVAGDALGLKVTELWNTVTGGRPVSYTGSVAPDGSVNFGPSTLSDVAREILPLFAPQFAQDKTLEQGAAWNVNFDRSNIHATTRYTVSSIDGDLVTLAKAEDVKVIGARGGNYTERGTIRFKPSLLVAVSGDLEKRMSSDSASDSAQQTLGLHFERLSDTREAARAH